MDKTSKKIINLLKQHPDDILWYSSRPYKQLEISEEEFYRCVRYLASQNLIEFAQNQDNIHLGIALSHVAVHSREIKRDSFFNWLLHSYVGGVITGVTSTLATEALAYLCVKLVQLLLR